MYPNHAVLVTAHTIAGVVPLQHSSRTVHTLYVHTYVFMQQGLPSWQKGSVPALLTIASLHTSPSLVSCSLKLILVHSNHADSCLESSLNHSLLPSHPTTTLPQPQLLIPKMELSALMLELFNPLLRQLAMPWCHYNIVQFLPCSYLLGNLPSHLGMLGTVYHQWPEPCCGMCNPVLCYIAFRVFPCVHVCVVCYVRSRVSVYIQYNYVYVRIGGCANIHCMLNLISTCMCVYAM